MWRDHLWPNLHSRAKLFVKGYVKQLPRAEGSYGARLGFSFIIISLTTFNKLDTTCDNIYYQLMHLWQAWLHMSMWPDWLPVTRLITYNQINNTCDKLRRTTCDQNDHLWPAWDYLWPFLNPGFSQIKRIQSGLSRPHPAHCHITAPLILRTDNDNKSGRISNVASSPLNGSMLCVAQEGNVSILELSIEITLIGAN